MKKKRNVLAVIAATVFWVGLWALISWRIGKEVLVPSPAAVAVRLWELLSMGEFWLSVGRSLLHILIGYAAGIAGAVLLAMLCHVSRAANALISPALTVIRATPVASFIILVLVFLGKEFVPSLICFLMVLPVVFGSVSNGIGMRDKKLIEMQHLFRVPALRRFFRFDVPAVLPFFREGSVTAIGLAWKAGIAAEVLCTPPNTIGIALHEARLYLETTDVFCWTLVVILLSLLLEWLLGIGTKRKEEGGNEVH